MNKKVLIASPKHMIAEGVCLRLLQEPDLTIVGWGQTPAEFETLYAQYLPDVILICISFKGTQTTQYMRERVGSDERIRFLCVSQSIERHLVIEVMESGARGFVSPCFAGFSELIPAVHSVANGGTYVCQKAAEQLLGGLFNRNQPIEQETLSEREKQVVRLVSDGYSSKEIARMLNISPSTVEVHRRNIMRKIGAHKTADLTRYAIRSQLVTL